jgi:hypothetical protein
MHVNYILNAQGPVELVKMLELSQKAPIVYRQHIKGKQSFFFIFTFSFSIHRNINLFYLCDI